LNKIISRENIYVRECLNEVLGVSESGEAYLEENYLEDCLYSPDFYIPSVRLTVEINGKNKFYPHSRRHNNFSSMKNRLV
jgi:hypothetical protein